MTKTLYAATSKYVEEINNLPVKRQVSVSGILKKLDVSRSGYNAWKKRVPSDTSIRRTVLKEKIQKIYDDSHQNYGAPKIAAELRKSGETITEKTVGNYMRQMGIKAQWIKPYTQTTIDSDLSQKLKNILNENTRTVDSGRSRIFQYGNTLNIIRIEVTDVFRTQTIDHIQRI